MAWRASCIAGFALERIDSRPGLNDPFGVALLHRGDKIVRTRRGADRRLQVESHQNCFDSGGDEFLHNFRFRFRRPGAVPVFGQRIDIRLLAGDPFARVRIAMNVDNSH